MTVPATLHIAETITCPRDANLSNLPIELELTWKGEDPLELDLYVHHGRIAVGPEVQVEIVDDQGKDVPIWYFVSIPPIPEGKITVQKDQSLRFPVMIWNGTARFPKEGTYQFRVHVYGRAAQKHTIQLQSQTKTVRIKFEKSLPAKSV